MEQKTAGGVTITEPQAGMQQFTPKAETSTTTEQRPDKPSSAKLVEAAEQLSEELLHGPDKQATGLAILLSGIAEQHHQDLKALINAIYDLRSQVAADFENIYTDLRNR
ncbi:MAG TPA: hypothetical protein VMW16_08640 [Sedimentisphaerales bacterium]|nr:hypothetical protein [Sedimentisphaerales bacterium]